MSRWFRHYAGMVRDDKLVRASLRCKQSIERVVWIYGAVLESAAELDDDGRYEIDVAEIAYFLRCKSPAVEQVLNALKELGRIDGTCVTAWAKRQFKSDRSNARVAAHRDKKRSQRNGDETLQVTGGVTLPERDGNSPETETETETDITLAKANGAFSFLGSDQPASPQDADKQFWDTTKAYLASAGVKNPGAVVGRWIRDHGKSQTAEALTRAQLERAVEPVAFVQGCFRAVKGGDQPSVPL